MLALFALVFIALVVIIAFRPDIDALQRAKALKHEVELLRIRRKYQDEQDEAARKYHDKALELQRKFQDAQDAYYFAKNQAALPQPPQTAQQE